MAAPTPVSAYLHAAAMVKAGIYLIARLAPVFAIAAPWRPDRDLARRLHDAARRHPGAARDRPQAHPRLRHREPARAADRRARLRHAGCRARRPRPPDRPRPVQVGPVPGRRRHRPPAVHARHRRAQRRRPAGAGDGGRDVHRGRLDGRRHPDDRLRRQGGRAHRAPERGAGRCPVGHRRADRRRTRLGADGGVRHPLPLGRVLDEEGCRRRRPAADAMARPAHRVPRGSRDAGADHAGRGLRIARSWMRRCRATPDAARRHSRRPGTRSPLPPRALARARARAVASRSAAIALGALVFWFTRGWMPRMRVLPFTAADVYNGAAARHRPRCRSPPRPSPSAARCRSTSARSSSSSSPPRARRCSPAGAGRPQLDALPDADAAGGRADHDRGGPRSPCGRASATPASCSSRSPVSAWCMLFATSGAPDLALTQILVETVTLVAFALVLRRIPARMGDHNASVWPVARAVLAVAVGATMAVVAIVATARPHRDADLGVLPRARVRARATARTSSTSRSSTCAAGTRWASCRCSSSRRRAWHPSSS